MLPPTSTARQAISKPIEKLTGQPLGGGTRYILGWGGAARPLLP